MFPILASMTFNTSSVILMFDLPTLVNVPLANFLKDMNILLYS